MVRPFRGKVPKVAATAYIDPSAQVIGDITIGERSSVWPNVSARGDVSSITIGNESNVQDNSVMHCDEGFPLIIGDRVTVGHMAMLHGCVIEDDTLIGIGAIVLNGARIGKGSVIAASALIPEGMQVPPYSMVMGVPGKVKREITADERERFQLNCQHYVELAGHYRADNDSDDPNSNR
jgi:carbonic anhydrase/acetyltransferase-like protein (isoleucine patch superfamily)